MAKPTLAGGGKTMETITITDKFNVNNRSQSKYTGVYQQIDQALECGRDIMLTIFESLKSAILLSVCIRRYYADRCYIGLRKYGHNGVIAPEITISPRAKEI